MTSARLTTEFGYTTDMQIHTQAISPFDDSIAYMLLNLCHIEDSLAEPTMRIEYFRDYALTARNVTHAELDKAQQGLTDAIREIFSTTSNSYGYMMDSIVATAAILFDGYYDLKPSGLCTTSYPLITDIKSVKSAPAPNLFEVTCTSFKTQVRAGKDIPAIVLNKERQLLVSPALLDYVWPGSSKHVPIMESLGYTPDEVLDTLYKGVPSINTTIDVGPLQFD